MFESIFASEIAAFLELSKNVVSSNVFKHDKATLATLDRHLVEYGHRESDLSEEVLTAWIRTLRGKSKTVSSKVQSIRNFVRYLNGMGGHSFLPDAPKVKSDYIPYIFSDDELSLLIRYADNLEPKRANCAEHFTAKMAMVLRILCGCGTRLGETMALKRKDIDFKASTIFLRKTKYSKERLIPAHDTLMGILERYCLALAIMLSPEAYLFSGRKPGTHLTTRWTHRWFTELLRLANIDQRERKLNDRGASLHCYRHIFVLKSMQQLEAAGHPADLNDLLLPTYLGHVCLLDTDKYMRFSGAQVPESLDKFEAFTTGLIPKVEVPYEDD